MHAIANNGKQQYRPITALNGGVNTFAFSLDECDGDECNEDVIPDCYFFSVWDPVCGCNDVTYSNSAEAACNNIFYFTEGPCESSVNLISYINNNKSIVNIFDISGRKIDQIQEEKIIIILYDNGSIEKKYIN